MSAASSGLAASPAIAAAAAAGADANRIALLAAMASGGAGAAGAAGGPASAVAAITAAMGAADQGGLPSHLAKLWQFKNSAAAGMGLKPSSSSDAMMPLSPPQTPLPPPPALPRFQPAPTATGPPPPPQLPYHLLMAYQQQQQNNPFLNRQPGVPTPEALEQIRLLHLSAVIEQQQRMAAVAAIQQNDLLRSVTSEKASEDGEDHDAPLDVINNDDEGDIDDEEEEAAPKKPSVEEMKRELEQVEDEMKESADDEDASKEKEEKAAEDSEVTTTTTAASNSVAAADSSGAPMASDSFRVAMMKKLLELKGGSGAEDDKQATESVMEFLRQHQMKQQQQMQDVSSTPSSIDGAAAVGSGGGGGGCNLQYEDSLNSDGNDDSQDEISTTTLASAAPLMNVSASSAEDRKVRVRTLISEEQLTVLKTYYGLNPRPKREELERIAAKIGHPFKVVKVWFQNSRARDRREGKHVSPLQHGGGGGAGLTLPNFVNGESPSQPFLNNNFPQLLNASGLFPRLDQPGSGKDSDAAMDSADSSNEASGARATAEQPLDLSAKGSSPSVSPISNRSLTPTTHNSAIAGLHSSLNQQLEQQFRAAAAAAMAGSKFPFVFPGQPSPAAAIMPPLPPPVAAFGSFDVYRFTDDVNKSPLSAGEEDGTFPCPKCDKVFTKKSSLARHKFDHSGELITS